MTGPDHVSLHGTVVLRGIAAAGAPVTIWRRERGKASYTASATVTAGTTGTFSWGYPADDDFRWYATTSAG